MQLDDNHRERARPIKLPAGDPIVQVDFERHIAPLFTRLGCNAGSCHGASDGKGGFRLSLFGHDKLWDYSAITAEGSGRVDTDIPENSLILEKPTLSIDHEGGLRMSIDSWEYQLLSRWIRDGALHAAGSGQISRIDVEPGTTLLTRDNPAVDLHVIATFADGERQDVTSFASLRTQDELIATVSESGKVERLQAGDTAVIATYNGHPSNASILIPADGMPGAVDERESSGLVDRHISKKLRQLRIEPAAECSDETFLRRVTLAVIGQLPAPESIREFVADSDPDKRIRAIEALLADPLHAAMWATRMCEITGSGDVGDSRMQLGSDHEQKWHAWFRRRFAENLPYDQLARNVLCGTTRDELDAASFIRARMKAAEDGGTVTAEVYATHQSLDLFWQRPKVNEEIDVEAITERIAAGLLGVRLECARCHKHPFDRWTQNDHRSFANYFTQVRFGISPALRSSVVDALDEQRERARSGLSTRRIPRIREVYVSTQSHALRDPTTQVRLPVKPLGGEEADTVGDRRVAFVDWLTAGDNPYFARNFVNRVWKRYFGIGLVDPVDAFSAGNPPSHPQLLDALARDFIEHGFDIRRLETQVLQSQAWQRSSSINDTNQGDRRNFSRAYVYVLPAEVVVDAITSAVGDQQSRAVELAGSRSNDAEIDTYFEVFQRPQRKLTCDCEQRNEPTLRQTMLLLSDPRLLTRIREGHVARLTESGMSDEKVVDKLFLLALSRWPDDDERHAALQHLESSSERQDGLTDIMWGLINTREFVTRH